jgi:hypothetical protein
MPRGQSFDNPLRTTKRHRHDAAEIYRAIGRDAALAAWEKFLVEESHDKVTAERELDDNGISTGKYYADEQEAMWLLHDFVLEHGIPKPVPPAESAAPEPIEFIAPASSGPVLASKPAPIKISAGMSKAEQAAILHQHGIGVKP